MNTPNGNQHHQINIVSALHNQPSQLPPSNLPRRDLLDGGGEDFNAICVPLYKAITSDDFEAAKLILEKRPELVQFSITERCETILHVAVLGKSCLFVQYLMSLMRKEDLELPNGNGETTLCLVARTGNVEIAKTLVKKNEGLIDIPNSQGTMPLQVAATYGRHDMVKYLYNTSQKMIGQFWTLQNRSMVFEKCVEGNIFDLAMQMVIDYPELAINGRVLRLLARNRRAFLPTKCHPIFELKKLALRVIYKPVDEETKALQLLRIILKDVMKLPKVEIDDLIRGPPDEDAKQKYSSRVLFLATKMGNTAFVIEVIRQYPHLALEVNDDNHSIFHVAASHRHAQICRLLYEKDHIKDSIITLEDRNGNNILHLVGERAKGNSIPNITGMGVRTFREFQCFKIVESILPDYLCKKKNAVGLTPYELFIKNHKDIFSEEEKLMKETVSQLMVVAALVATISFATIITFPGGYKQDTGLFKMPTITTILTRKDMVKAYLPEITKEFEDQIRLLNVKIADFEKKVKVLENENTELKEKILSVDQTNVKKEKDDEKEKLLKLIKSLQDDLCASESTCTDHLKKRTYFETRNIKLSKQVLDFEKILIIERNIFKGEREEYEKKMLELTEQLNDLQRTLEEERKQSKEKVNDLESSVKDLKISIDLKILR